MDPVSGGACQAIRNTVPALEKLGVQNEVVTLDDRAATFLTKDAFKIHALGPSKGPWHYGSKLKPWLWENLLRFDVIIIHGLWLYYSHATALALRQIKRSSGYFGKTIYPKLYCMPHGMLDPYFQRAPDRKLKAVRNWIYWRLIEHRVVNDADGMLFTCEAELLLAREPFRPYHPKSELNVGLGIEQPPPYVSSMKEAFFKTCPELADQPYILFLSRIHEKKGTDLLIQAYGKTYQENFPKLVVAGPGLDTPYGQKIKHLAAQNGQINKNIFFPGMLSGEAKWGAFYQCDAFILPSHQENFGIAVVEAMACNKPVLISNQVNIWREIQAEGAGLVEDNTEEGTKKLLSGWMERSVSDRSEMGNKARRTFEKLYAIGPAAKHLVDTLLNKTI
jgi:glycosyltransferase involved in cell wall biosynthesis